jgi:RHS repeat-associated protein
LGTGVIRINFQPATATIPAGYYADKGSVYGVRTNGMSYGWALTATSDVVERNGAVPVPELDTLALMDPTSSGTTPPANVWEVALPNGSYPVIVVAGDPLHRNQTNDLQIENQSVTDPDPSSAQTYEQGDYDGYAVIATVADGKLSISQRSGGINAKLCFVEIGPEGTTIDSATLTRLADLMQQATDHTALTPGATTGLREYVYGSYVDEVLSYVQGATRYYVHANHLYSPAAITDSSGVVGERYTYDAYGKQTITASGGTPRNQSAVGFDRGFTGYILDQETGLYFARARMYSAGLGRFVSRDPNPNASPILFGSDDYYTDGYSLYFPYFAVNGLDSTGMVGENCGIGFVYAVISGPDGQPDLPGLKKEFGKRDPMGMGGPGWTIYFSCRKVTDCTSTCGADGYCNAEITSLKFVRQPINGAWAVQLGRRVVGLQIVVSCTCTADII